MTGLKGAAGGLSWHYIRASGTVRFMEQASDITTVSNSKPSTKRVAAVCLALGPMIGRLTLTASEEVAVQSGGIIPTNKKNDMAVLIPVYVGDNEKRMV